MSQLKSSGPAATLPVSEYESAVSWRKSLGLLNQLGAVIGLFVVFGFFAIMRPSTFLRLDNLQIMLLQTAVVGTAALGATVIIISGGIDLSVGSNIALCTVVIAKALLLNMSPMTAALLGIASGMACGLVMGLLVTLLKLPPFIVTLGLWGSIRGLAKTLANNTTVQPPETWLNDILHPLPPGKQWMIFPIGVWMMFVLTLFVAGVFRYTRFGRHIFAIGSNQQTARLCGVRVERTKLLIYIFATMFAGVAGLMAFSKLTVGDPTTANGEELNIIASVFIGGASFTGGKGGVFGTLIGALIMTVIANGCTKLLIQNSTQEIVTGGIIILAVTLDQLRQRRRT